MYASDPNPLSLLRRHAEVTEQYLLASIRQAEAPARLVEAIEYSVMAGGKRLRPSLVLECASA